MTLIDLMEGIARLFRRWRWRRQIVRCFADLPRWWPDDMTIRHNLISAHTADGVIDLCFDDDGNIRWAAHPAWERVDLAQFSWAMGREVSRVSTGNAQGEGE